jgi:membrane fusion protein (multidrug efflux system)
LHSEANWNILLPRSAWCWFQGRQYGFNLLPPENATGNYVKVVQGIPVRIDLDPRENKDHRLRPGMSVNPKVYLNQ